MSVQYFCDGCDKSLGSASNSIRVRVGGVDAWLTLPFADSVNYDLCVDCEARLRSVANPKNWVRASK